MGLHGFFHSHGPSFSSDPEMDSSAIKGLSSRHGTASEKQDGNTPVGIRGHVTRHFRSWGALPAGRLCTHMVLFKQAMQSPWRLSSHMAFFVALRRHVKTRTKNMITVLGMCEFSSTDLHGLGSSLFPLQHRRLENLVGILILPNSILTELAVKTWLDPNQGMQGTQQDGLEKWERMPEPSEQGTEATFSECMKEKKTKYTHVNTW
ncbi:uncharacterized protein LOC116418682 [Piliocolobus tephrosceles]|uniref:uncharacterized protein LOC116418682 n=1 Tax=Piliocolobus tephrosceles TaxID=591936 RepID=UPI0013017B8E|nr:uncharacterized protein LOC116418682 [Piliocolobus tephrosceles]